LEQEQRRGPVDAVTHHVVPHHGQHDAYVVIGPPAASAAIVDPVVTARLGAFPPHHWRRQIVPGCEFGAALPLPRGLVKDPLVLFAKVKASPECGRDRPILPVGVG